MAEPDTASEAGEWHWDTELRIFCTGENQEHIDWTPERMAAEYNALTARVAEADAEMEAYVQHHEETAHAAPDSYEARVTKLRQALQKIEALPGGLNPDLDIVRSIARAALRGDEA